MRLARLVRISELPRLVNSVESLAGVAPDLAVECAGQQAVRAYGEAVLAGRLRTRQSG